jgi:two-component system sensor histidine kinase PilS (NtrC family)
MDQNRKLVWFILVRVVVVSLFLISTIILNVTEPESIADVALAGIIKLIVATYLFSIGSLLVLKFARAFQDLLTTAQIVWDLILITLLLLLTGGIASPFSFLYFLNIINASFLIARREALYTAAISGILYGAIIDLQYYGKLTPLGLSALPAQQYGAIHLFYTIFLNIVAFFLTALVTGYLAERAIKSETALHEKVINYQELERLNTLIVTNLDSGLVTLNAEGRIRVFNRYAAEIIGLSQEDAYDRHLAEVIPAFNAMPMDLFAIARGEIEHEFAGNTRVLAFKTIPFAEKGSQRAAVLLEFQDRTRLKQMTERLKRADRLAAIGELSARLAHEIRNPLASISGSVQLIAESDGIESKDKKLLGIVLRETDRLNGLVGDFLAYARPSQPVKEMVPLRTLLEDLSRLLKGDPRFDGITLVNDCPPGLAIPADRGQMQQVFWNLMANAADAMPEGGAVEVSAALVNYDHIGITLGNVAKIEVRDHGVGMAGDDVNKVFEPFFTTKAGGSGLGLATVYRIIEAHGGSILVDSVASVGTTFTMLVPVEEDSDVKG